MKKIEFYRKLCVNFVENG